MQFNREFISNLGTKSLSQNPELTKKRINAAWSTATKDQQDEVLYLADVPYNTAYRVRKMGTITTKMTIAYSQALNLDPYYLIGLTDENNGYSYDAAKKLLIGNKCGKLVKEFEANNQPKEEIPPEKEKSAETDSEPKKDYSIAAAVQKLNEDDLLGLFKALIIKAGVGKPEAVLDLTKITEILLK